MKYDPESNRFYIEDVAEVEAVERFHAAEPSYENDAFEIARRVLSSYNGGKEPEEAQVSDLGRRIHAAAAGIANERVERTVGHNFDVLSLSDGVIYVDLSVEPDDYPLVGGS